jgi:hypothetical protein
MSLRLPLSALLMTAGTGEGGTDEGTTTKEQHIVLINLYYSHYL